LPKLKVSKFGISFTTINGAPNLEDIVFLLFTHKVLIVGAKVDQFQQFLLQTKILIFGSKPKLAELYCTIKKLPNLAIL